MTTAENLDVVRGFLEGDFGNPKYALATRHTRVIIPPPGGAKPPDAPYIRNRGNPVLVLSPSGYHLLYYLNGAYILNLDRGVALPIGEERHWRREAARIAREMNIPLIPVAVTALARIEETAPFWAWTSEVTFVDPVTGAVKRTTLPPPPGPVLRPLEIDPEKHEAVFSVVADETKYYLSGFDEQEDPPLYFLCQLPHPVSTIDGAREALKPDSVRVAEGEGRKVVRQGDLFFIDTNLTAGELTRAGGKLDKNAKLYGTNHFAQGAVTLPSGVMFARGRVWHDPRGRDPDHRDIRLGSRFGRGWWMVARNTVPVAPRATTEPVQRIAQLAEARAAGVQFSDWLERFARLDDF